jgi:septal ring factor EnvC (AmiA/AmiB activator)
VERDLKNHDKELVTIKGQLNRIKHENQNMSNKLNEAEQDVEKIKNLQQKYVKFNQLNWKTNNDLICFQVDLERMTINYAKMEESNLEQQGIITNLERTY